MIPTTTIYEHIQPDANGVPLIAGTTMKVVELVMAQIAHGWSPEELFFQHPYLTLGQIHAALAYYWDHRQELDADIERRARFAEAARARRGGSCARNRHRWMQKDSVGWPVVLLRRFLQAYPAVAGH